jgi:biopolymer transport protein TolR
MLMTLSKPPAALSSDMNVTPMLDVLLVLLVIFMAAAQTRQALDAVLPTPCEGPCRGGDAAIVLEVLPGGIYRLNMTPLASTDLVARLRAVYAGRADKVLQVAGHRRARYQDVIGAMDAARSAGVRVIAIPPGNTVTGSHPGIADPGSASRQGPAMR